jgi:hypothetical protein
LLCVAWGGGGAPQKFGCKEAQFGKAVSALVTDVATLGAAKAWLAQLADEVLAAVTAAVPYAVYSKYVLPVLLPLLRETTAPAGAANGSAAAAAPSAEAGDVEEGSDEEAPAGAGAGAGGEGDAGANGTAAPGSASSETRRTSADRVALGLVMLRKGRGEGESGGVPGALRTLAAMFTPGKVKGLVEPALVSAASFPRLHVMWSHVLQWLVDAGGLQQSKQLGEWQLLWGRACLPVFSPLSPLSQRCNVRH